MALVQLRSHVGGDSLTGYQYQISERNPRAVEVRYKQPHAGRPTLWRLYQLCDSEDDAEHMLGLLQQPLEMAEVRE